MMRSAPAVGVKSRRKPVGEKKGWKQGGWQPSTLSQNLLAELRVKKMMKAVVDVVGYRYMQLDSFLQVFH